LSLQSIKNTVITMLKKHIKIIIFIIIIVICFIITYFKSYNKISVYDSLEQAIEHKLSSKVIKSIVESRNSVFIEYKKDGSTTQHLYFIKENGKLKYDSSKSKNSKISACNGSIIVVQETEIGDTYIEITRLSNSKNEAEIFDSLNSQFHEIINQTLTGTYRYRYYAILEKIPDNYYISIDNEQINI